MRGIHLTADIAGCPSHLPLMTDADSLRRYCLEFVDTCGLTAVSEVFHAFPGLNAGECGGVTGTVLLAESHLALHTWPELGAVTLDVYVCNFSMDNSGKAAKLLDCLIKLFQPTEIVRNQLIRGEVGATATTI
jgi:S-adenosylmethionine decarboxylase proenzyme